VKQMTIDSMSADTKKNGRRLLWIIAENSFYVLGVLADKPVFRNDWFYSFCIHCQQSNKICKNIYTQEENQYCETIETMKGFLNHASDPSQKRELSPYGLLKLLFSFTCVAKM